MPTTDAALKAAKATDRPLKISDGGGLFLLVQPGGSRLWRLAYRFAGKQKTLALGPYPAVSLREARDKREEAKRLLRDGIDPSAQRREARLSRATSAATTFRAVSAELLERKRREDRAPGTLKRVEQLLAIANPAIGDRPVAELSAPEILALLRKVEGRGTLETARRLRATIGETIRYAIATGRAHGDPTPALRNAIAVAKPTHFGALTNPADVGALLRAIADYPSPIVRYALQLGMLCAVRPGELRHAQWSEVSFAEGIWRIPPERMKLRRPHMVPLSKQALAVLRALHELTGDGKADLLVPGSRVVVRPISDATLGAAFRRMGYAAGEVTAHGSFRATFSTLANQSGLWSSDVIERQLAHEDADAIRRAYARSDYWDDRVRLMNWWGEYIEKLRDGNKVMPLARPA